MEIGQDSVWDRAEWLGIGEFGPNNLAKIPYVKFYCIERDRVQFELLLLLLD